MEQVKQIELISKNEIVEFSDKYNLTEKIVKIAILTIFEHEIVERTKTK